MNIEKYYTLSPMQEGMLFHSLYNEGMNTYFEQLSINVRGFISIQDYEYGLNELIKRHDIFRTIFNFSKTKKPFQIVLSKRTTKIHYENLEHLPFNEQRTIVKNYKEKDLLQGFDLTKDLLMRVAVFKLNNEKYDIVWSFHHILMDGWCLGIVLKEWMELYLAKLEGRLAMLEPVNSYSNYIQWLEKQDREESLAYWGNYLDGYEITATLPYKSPDKATVEYTQKELEETLDETLTDKLNQVARRFQVTTNTVFQTIWGLILQRYNRTDDVVFGAVVSGRPAEIKGIESMVGLFINTVPVRIKCDTEMKFGELLQEVQRVALEGEKYNYSPLYEVQAKSQLGNNLLDHIIIFENYPTGDGLKEVNPNKASGFEIEQIHAFEQTNYDFNITVKPGKSLGLNFSFNANVYLEEDIHRTIKHILQVIEIITEDPEILVEELDIIPEDEKQLLRLFNATETKYPRDKTIQQLFEEQVEKTPDEIAVICGEEQISYRELNRQANRLAHQLRKNGVTRNMVVGLLVERSIQMIVGLIGVLKAGAAYIPLDPNYPIERIMYMLEDSGTQLLLTQSWLKDQLLSDGLYINKIIDIDLAIMEFGEEDNPLHVNSIEDLVYIIYTSGTTGNPKGVMVQQKQFVNVYFGWREKYDLTHLPVRILQLASFSFDVFAGDTARALLSGGMMLLCPENDRYNISRLYELLEQYKITIMESTPALIIPLMRYIHENRLKLLHLRLLIVGSDIVSKENFVWLLHNFGDSMRIINSYGVTEACIDSSYYESEVLSCEGKLPVGKPLPNIHMYTLDTSLRLVPINAVGELYIGGAGVARGYLNRPELTAEKFVENPYRPRERMYRTGDLARWLPDGNIEFLGRMDHQVKIRGYRIEPGEIENQLLKHPKVREAVVIAQLESDGQSQALCAYVVGDSGLKSSILREYLSQELPEYMIPSYFIALEELPLTPNGKVDRKALPKPEAGMASGRAYEAPSNEIESQMAEIWQGVLGREKVGLNDHFFELGGHSLKATALASAIHKQFDVEIPLKQIFKTPTMRELAAYTAEADRRKYRPIERIAEREWYPVSSAQKRLLILQQLEGGDASYNMPSVFLLEGDLDVACLEQALVKMTERHEALRTSFEWINGEPVQRIHPRVEIKLGYSQASFEEGAELTKSFVRPFDLSKAPLMRAELIQISEEKHLFMLDMHHVVSDGVSMGIFMDELSQMYDGKELGQPRIQYKDYSEWQQARFQSEEMEKQKAYWLEHLGGELPILDLPTDYSRPSVQSFEGNHIFFEADPNLSDGLKNIARETGSTLYMVLLAAYQVLLSRYSGQEDIIVGTPTAGRLHADTEDVLGLFVNTLAVRGCPEGQKTVKSFIEEVKKATLGAYEHQEYPFEELVNQLNIPRDLSRNPLFSTLFVLQNIKQTQLKLGEVQAEPYHMEYQISKFDMSIEAVEQEGRIRFGLEYATRLFREETVGRIAENYIQVLKEFAWNSEKQLGEIKVLTKEEKQLLESFNATGTIYAEEKTIQQLFEEQVERTPEAIAVVSEKEQVSYRELNLRANRLAHVLRVQGVKRDEIIGLMVERTPEMVVGILGILKSGAAYVPLDPAYPEERITYMLADSGAHILLTQDSLEEQVTSLKKNYAGSILDIEQAEAMSDTDENPEPINKSEDLAYVIYTSGSTGKPKGVMLEHRGLINAQLLWENSFGIVPEDRIVQFASSSFDASVWEIFMALFAGAKLYIPSKETILDSQRFVDYIGKNKLTVLTLPPTYLSTIESKQLKGVRLLITAGSAIHPELAERYMQEMNYVNAYGPSEATICVTVWIPETKKIENSVVPIGKPISNAEVYITDENGELQPIGVAGELCIGGAGVARGYLNQPELTAEKFVENPYRPGERMYRTGDVARWLPDGNIEFLGRIDHQVKIRGYRIEPGEIENQLLKHPKVREAVVIAQLESDGQSQALCAYVVGDSGLKSSMLREYLSQELPEYMIPSYFVALEELPLTPNGKVDRKALPKPEVGMASGRAYEAPSNEIESQMAEIWQGVLGREKVGLNDHFFELGGHSLKATALASAIHKQFDVEIPLKQIFKTPTMRELAAYTAEADRRKYRPIERIAEREWYPVSSAQKRLLILQQLEGGDASYNMPSVFLLEGDLDVACLEQALVKMTERHEALRTSFEWINGEPVQRIHPRVEIKLGYSQASFEEGAELTKSFVRPFDLSKAPLMRAELIQISEEKHLFMLDMHHVVSDGVSMGIFMDELSQMYDGKELGQPRIQYKDYSEWQQARFQSEEMEKQKAYWLEHLGGELPILDLPTDYSRPSVQSFEGNHIFFEADPNLSDGLKNIARETGSTLYMVLLAAYQVLLSRYSGQEDIIVGTPTAGRLHADTEDVLGLFVNTLAVRGCPEGQKTVKSFIEEVKKATLGAYEHQEYPFEELVNQLNIPRDLSRNPLFSTLFVLQNIKQTQLKLGEVQAEPYHMEYQISKFDMSIEAVEQEGRIRFGLEYATRLFREETVGRIAENYIQVLKEFAWNSEKQLGEIKVLTKEEKQLLESFNATGTIYAEEKTIQQLFEEQVERTPEAIAVVSEKEQVSYRELNLRANRLAHVLRARGVKRDEIIGLMVERTPEMIVGILGILKSGAAYVPLDPAYPEERITYMLADSGAHILLTQDSLEEQVTSLKKNYAGSILDIEQAEAMSDTDENPEPINKSEDLAYVIYTSGSTGKPKGVMISHISVNNFFEGMKRVIDISEHEAILSVTSISFDISILELLWTISNGIKVVLHYSGGITGYQLYSKDYLDKINITLIQATPSRIQIMLQNSDTNELFKNIKTWIVGGEPLSNSLVNELSKFNKTKIINMYGPTETTIWSTSFEVFPQKSRVFIGKPIINTRIFILNEKLKRVPIGVIGEIFIGGQGVSRGYLNRDELTNEKFLNLDLGSGMIERVYKTGDLGRFLPDGTIEFIGRADSQIKMRGYRIELAEIEGELIKLEGIKQAIVIEKESGTASHHLAAFIEWEDTEPSLSPAQVKLQLQRQLPYYMIPLYYINLKALPLTPNGKLDRKSLKEINVKTEDKATESRSLNNLEATLLKVWRELFQRYDIGVEDDFFEIGGNSLLAVKLEIELEQNDIYLEELAVYKYRTIKQLALFIENVEVVI
ncbi:amino acid adenylation domain-containing protein [Paenibacillus sp. FSL R5-0744]|uniref:non-ribosomal peptide synthetase n=1 Tax=Paenibacillus sp. FSL R5-0744 TaxID=2921656 RepID=UPI0030D821CC